MPKKEVKPEIMEEDSLLDIVNPLEEGAEAPDDVDSFIPGEVSEDLTVQGVRIDENGQPVLETYDPQYPTEAHRQNRVKASTDPTIEETTLDFNPTVILRKKVKS